MENLKKKDPYRCSRLMYILQAALEYFVSIMVAGAFLAKVTASIGMSDALTGILSSFISLCCLFQLPSVLIRRHRVKPLVIALNAVQQLTFVFVFFLPLFGWSSTVNSVLFTLCFFLAYALSNLARPKRMNWHISLIKDGERGSFTAVKEVVSLIVGMGFSYLMGARMDTYTASGELQKMFRICGAVVLFLMVAHTVSLLLTDEKPQEVAEKTDNDRQGFRSVLTDRTVRHIVLLSLLWNVALYCATPFYGTYQISELGFSLRFVTLTTLVGSVVRVLVSGRLGKYADKRSFAAMLKPCFGVMCIGFLCVAFAVPANGKWMFILYNICYGFAMSGINSGITNMVFDIVLPEKRADAFALTQSVSGVVGFVATLAVSPLVSYIQGQDNTLFGMPVYAQQVISLVAFGFTALTLLYLSVFLAPIKTSRQKDEIKG